MNSINILADTVSTVFGGINDVVVWGVVVVVALAVAKKAYSIYLNWI